ncbi:MAG: 6-phosphofructokinase [Clostridia bacterium]|nr:6-phosphofructokinase [Clostridia bacterium]
MNTIGIMTSGGDSPGMNAAIRAVVKQAKANGIKVIGINKGYKGLIEMDCQELTSASVEDLYRKGGTILKTARYKNFKDPEVVAQGVENCKKLGIEGMVVIGGDGSFRGARDLTHAGIPCVGIPGTIDNDIVCTEDTIGFDSSMNIITDCISKLRDTSETLDRCSVIEVMGAGAGWMALEGGIASGADIMLVPEVEFDFQKDVIDLIKAKKESGQNYFVIVIAECVFFPESNSKHKKNKNFQYVNENGIETVEKFTKKFQEMSGIESRATVLGHIQRGGAPTFHDCILATNMGVHAVELLKNNKSARVVVVKDGKITDFDIDEGLAMKKPFDKDRLEMATKLNF